jgi:hypothetical protein
MRRRKRKNVSGIVKTVPLSIAFAALSSGVAFADAEYDHVQVDLGNGGVYEFDLGLVSNDAAYAERVKKALAAAFEGGQSILVQVGENEWVEFGENASADLTLSDLKNDPNAYAGTRNPNADLVLPSPY